MPSGKNWVNFLYVNIAFVLYVAGIFYFNQMSQIQANWPLYRCNPMYMPLADNVEENFTYCIQTMQSGFMGHLLQPLTFITNSLTSSMGDFMTDIQNIRGMFNKVRTFFTTIIESVFGIFLNLIIEFQKITIGIKDLMGKTVGIMVTLMYTMEGSIKTMQSVNNGPPGQMLRALGKCFHPLTNIKLNNETVKKMVDIEVGDILEDGSFVEAVMKIDNKREAVPLYVIKDEIENIYVTGSHMVFDTSQNKFVRVDKYKKATLTNIYIDYFCCLITSNQKIKIGNEIFHDYNDFYLKL